MCLRSPTHWTLRIFFTINEFSIQKSVFQNFAKNNQPYDININSKYYSFDGSISFYSEIAGGVWRALKRPWEKKTGVGQGPPGPRRGPTSKIQNKKK